MKLESYFRTAPHKSVSEDAIVLNDRIHVYGVFDGATPLVPFTDEHGKNGAYLASHLFKDYFLRLYRSNLSLVEGITAANRMLRDLMERYQVNQDNFEELWSTCAAIIQVGQDGTISYAQLGDCMIIVEYQDGKVNALTEDTVKGISNRAKLWRDEQRKNGVSLPDEEYFQETKQRLKFNRSLANKPNGYSVANGKEEVVHYTQHGQVKQNEIKALLLVSDGLFHPHDSIEDTFSKIDHMGIDQYAIELENFEKENQLRHDDKSGILIRFT
jgi:serine/threonine protein phosphatase PrpC